MRGAVLGKPLIHIVLLARVNVMDLSSLESTVVIAAEDLGYQLREQQKRAILEFVRGRYVFVFFCLLDLVNHSAIPCYLQYQKGRKE